MNIASQNNFMFLPSRMTPPRACPAPTQCFDDKYHDTIARHGNPIRYIGIVCPINEEESARVTSDLGAVEVNNRTY